MRNGRWARFTCTGACEVIGSRASWPAIAWKMSAQSSAVRASGPTVSSECESGMAPCRETRPHVVLRPVTPQAAAGSLTEPPVSEPSAPKMSRAATAAPDPLDEPPVMHSGRQGLQQSPQWSL